MTEIACRETSSPSEAVPLPRYVQIEPVGQCNLRCEMCPIQFRKDGPPHGPPAFMPFETFTRIVDQFPDLEELHLQGLGEPMMHPRFFDMVAWAAGKGIRVTTNTNLTLLNPRRARRAVTCGLAELHVSIDGATPSVYAHIRKRGKLGRVLRNLNLLAQAKRDAGTDLPVIQMVAVVMRQNLHELPDLVLLALQHEIKSLFVQHLCHDFGESSLPEAYNPMRAFVDGESLLGESLAKIERCFNEARHFAAEWGVDLRLPNPRPRMHPPGTPGPQRCNWPWRGAYFSYDGHAMPCCMIATPDRGSLGNANQTGVEDIWNGSAYREFRSRLDSDDPPEVCRSCALYHGVF